MCPIICTTTQREFFVHLTVSVWHKHCGGYAVYSERSFKNARILFCFIENVQYKIILPFFAGGRVKVSCLCFLYIKTWHTIHSPNWEGLSRHYSFVCAQNTRLFLMSWMFNIVFTSAIISTVEVLRTYRFPFAFISLQSTRSLSYI
jgi:hypothetical protein